ncbi:MAG: S8 family peptidase [Gammaproteobacteria bacterium]
MASGPIQVVLNSANFHVDREKPTGGGPGTDFFANNDQAFVQHREAMRTQLESVASRIESDPRTTVSYGKVTIRRSMWAKSHRPTRALFRPERTPLVGGAGLGQLLVELTPDSARQVARDIAGAEDHVRTRFNEKTQREEKVPSTRRSETGAIESITLWQPQDRRRFTTQQALQWLGDPRSGGAYLVELFERPQPEPEWDALPAPKRELFHSFRSGLAAIGPGLVVEGRTIGQTGRTWVLVKLNRTADPPLVQLERDEVTRARQLPSDTAERDLRPERHEALLTFLDHHPLVRGIRLQPRPHQSEHSMPATSATPPAIPSPADGQAYPNVGVIDGGIGVPLKSWVKVRWGLVADAHQDTQHGTFIGGLLVAGRSLNAQPAIAEADGCELIDLALLPDDQQPAVFAMYYPNGVADFLDELQVAVAQLRSQYGVRIFNFSMNLKDEQVDPDFYSLFAERLDRIADATDSLFVISAGNLEHPDQRVEWPSDSVAALRSLATARADTLLTPAESVRNLSVAAINPEQVANCIPYALANYSRRGPGLRSGVKPDFCHVGGAGLPNPAAPTGLNSINDAGAVEHGCGTSYAAPLVAKTLAVLDHAIEGDVSRETLLALLVHHASLPAPFRDDAISALARDLVGFGLPANADKVLEGDEHQITLVFAGRLMEGKQLTFHFSWPDVLTGADGRCRGYARLTLVTSPPLDYRYNAELVRVNVNARLQQATEDGKWKKQLYDTYLPASGDEALYESERIEHGFKWSPVKTYGRKMKGVGKSSSWRLVVDYLTRANEAFPAAGVPFTVVLTIADPINAAPVFNSMRQALQSLGIQISDIRTAARVVARV